MTLKRLLTTLDAGDVAAVKAAAWAKLVSSFEVGQTHATGVAGDLLVGVLEGRRVAVEQASPDLMAVRIFASQKAEAAFVRERMAAYDRMWDG